MAIKNDRPVEQVRSAPRAAMPKAASKPPSAKGFKADELSTGAGGALRREATKRLNASGLAGGPRYDPTNEFGFVQDAVQRRFGPQAASIITSLIGTMQAGQALTLAKGPPQPGDVMMWGPNAGDRNGPVGGADEHGHVALVDSVVKVDDRTYQVTLSEKNWDTSTPGADGVQHRTLTLTLKDDGTIAELPDGVGFLPLSPAPYPQPITPTATQPTPSQAPVAPLAGPSTPPVGPAPVPSDIPKPSTIINLKDKYTGCVGYIHDRGDFADVFPAGLTVDAKDIRITGFTPRQGDLMVWGDNIPPDSGEHGHVAYLERVTPNLVDGKIASYTLTVSEAKDPDIQQPYLRSFTVAARPDGTAVLPDRVGFRARLGGATAPTAPSVGVGAPIAPHGTYVVAQGDTLSGIATRAGVDLGVLERAIPGIDYDLIRPGDRLNIP